MNKSAVSAWGAMIIILIVIIICMSLHIIGDAWEYVVLFLVFMAGFCHLASTLLKKTSVSAAKKLDLIALIFGILGVIGLITVFILDWCSM